VTYHASVQKIFVFVSVITALLCGCERTVNCPQIGTITRVVVHDYSKGAGTASDRTITDPEQIRNLVTFTNARRRVAQPTTYTMPMPRITATFYNNADYVGAIGAGPNFFFVSCIDGKGIRAATDTEIKEFKRLFADAE
jgi:hypothetical protein